MQAGLSCVSADQLDTADLLQQAKEADSAPGSSRLTQGYSHDDGESTREAQLCKHLQVH